MNKNELKSMKNEIQGKLFCHIKTGKIYRYEREVINATNKNDGEKMVLYSKDNMYFAREKTEFYEKFIPYPVKENGFVILDENEYTTCDIEENNEGNNKK